MSATAAGAAGIQASMAHPALQSMTGFARADGAVPGWRWTWEIRSVNGKGLDIRFRPPPGFDHFEPAVRERAGKRFSRGNLQVGLAVQRDGGSGQVRINEAMLDALLPGLERLRARIGGPPLSVDSLLAIRGIVEVGEADLATTDESANLAILATLDAALDGLAAARSKEGAALAAILGARLDRIEALTLAAESAPARTPEAIRARLAEQVALLLGASPAFDPDRLHQEAILLATRADIREELDRLSAHVVAARAMLEEGGAIGRRLDFLSQEFNRETNTLCAKASDRSLTAIGLDLKAVVDQFREQVQNLE